MAAQKTAKIIKRVPHFKTVLVTGAASYLGSKLCEKLLRQGFRVVGLDSSSTSFSNPRFIFLKADLKDALPKELQAVDYIFHLASNHYHTHAKEKDTLQSFLTNTEGTKRLLDFAVSCKAQFLQGSSVEIYKSITSALSIKNYFGETEEEKAKNSFFESKRVAESLVWEYVRGGKIDARIARLPNVYGPGFLGEGADNELSGFIAALGRGDAIVVYGEGLDKEFYNYVDDITDGLIKAQFDSDSEGKIYPLCDLEGVTTLELAYLVKSLARKDIDVEFKPGVEKEYPEYRVTDGQTLKDLGWEPKVGLKEGIGKTVGSGEFLPNLKKPLRNPRNTSYPSYTRNLSCPRNLSYPRYQRNPRNLRNPGTLNYPSYPSYQQSVIKGYWRYWLQRCFS
jgi:nucleoside-diphosphate-sugar epimerase